MVDNIANSAIIVGVLIGDAFEAEQEMDLFQIARLAKIAAPISRGFACVLPFLLQSIKRGRRL